MTGAERGVVAAAIVVSMLLGLIFLYGLGRPWRAPDELRVQAWLQSALVVSPVALELLLLLVVVRIPPPLWAVIGVLVCQDAVYTWRLLVLIRDRHERIRS